MNDGYRFKNFFSNHSFDKEGANEQFNQEPAFSDDSSNGNEKTKRTKENRQNRCLVFFRIPV